MEKFTRTELSWILLAIDNYIENMQKEAKRSEKFAANVLALRCEQMRIINKRIRNTIVTEAKRIEIKG